MAKLTVIFLSLFSILAALVSASPTPITANLEPRQNYVSLAHGCVRLSVDKNIFFAACKGDEENDGVWDNNWINLNLCLTYDYTTDGIYAQNGGHFYGDKKCKDCDMANDGDHHGKTIMRYKVLYDLNKDIYCFNHRASKLKPNRDPAEAAINTTPSPPPPINTNPAVAERGITQDYNVSLIQGCVNPASNWTLREAVFYAGCKGDPSAGFYQPNWMDLNKCLGYDPIKRIIVPMPYGNFYGTYKCHNCYLPNDGDGADLGNMLWCSCWDEDDGEYFSRYFDLNSVLYDLNSDLYCFGLKALQNGTSGLSVTAG
ncbi:hypothetical protein QBC46DRAFT_353147 [Diplogelasinospora grovesii]|uniref:Cyanovirin-N domain-containing protein n=1 Tax=Diplogelasinospora grovesii TaxID=303347 RepID=A0AAN6ND09_9PEZI|nr:hypothetical protein QBC46DRAFT_353147 [Diplogelasinospora grovesii]